MYRIGCFSIIFLLCHVLLIAQDRDSSPWLVTADSIDPSNYYGVTLANGMVGIVSSPDPLKVKDVVLNGVYDHYQRGRVSNILKVFNHVNMQMDVDGQRIDRSRVSQYKQSLDMQQAELVTTFKVGDKISVRHVMASLRHLPYTALTIIEITAHKDVEVVPMSVIESPIHLQDVRNYYAEIDRPHVLIPLMTSVGLSPTGAFKVAASNSFIFDEPHGNEPDIIHEDWDYNMHLMKFRKKMKSGETYRFAIASSVVSSEHHSDPHNEAERLTIFATLEKTDRLVKFHRNAWKELWDTGNVFVEGARDTERDIRFAIYHLYSFARAGTAYSLFVDSAPILERDWAKRSGQGWVGKNTLLIHPKKGSYFFLAEVILDVEFDYDHPMRDHCGTCTRCIDACPTDAISPEGYVLDGSKCISYLTIELKSSIPEEFKGQMENWIFGCDICQEVCPWNRFASPHDESAFLMSEQLQAIKREDWEEITNEIFDRLFEKSPLKRTGFEGLKRNIRFVDDLSP